MQIQKMVIQQKYQTMDKIVMIKTVKDSILPMDLNVLMFINLRY